METKAFAFPVSITDLANIWIKQRACKYMYTCTRVLEVCVGNSDSVDGMASVKPAGRRAHQRCRRPGTWRAESSCQRSALSSTLRAKHRAPCIPAYQVSGAYCSQTTPPCETPTPAMVTLCAACNNSVRNIVLECSYEADKQPCDSGNTTLHVSPKR